MSVEGWPGGPLPAGATFSQGYHLSTPPEWPRSQVENLIFACLYKSEALSEARIYQPTTGIFREYWQVDGRTKVGFDQAQHLQNTITGFIQSCGAPEVTVDSVFPLQIHSAPDPTYGNDVATRPPREVTGGGPDQAQCSWSRMSFGDYIACQLGIDRKTSAVVGLAGGVLLTFLVLRALR